MEARTLNANVHIENYYAYNNNKNNNKMSGFTLEQSQYEKATMIHGSKKFNNSFNGIEFMADDLNDEMQVNDRLIKSIFDLKSKRV